MALADSGGLAAASMRAVAGVLGATPGGLYRYVSSRDQLLDLMVDTALAELRLGGDPGLSWLDDLVALANDQLAVYRRHQWLLDVRSRGGDLGPHATDYFEYCLRIMAPLDCGTATKMEAIAMITGVVSLFARSAPTQGQRTSPAGLFGVASEQAHPHLIAALTESTPAAPRPDLFDRIIRSVLSDLLNETL
jgi:AcrR family transcriptional regulator